MCVCVCGGGGGGGGVTFCARKLYRAFENEIKNGGHRTKFCKNGYDMICPFGYFCRFVAD